MFPTPKLYYTRRDYIKGKRGKTGLKLAHIYSSCWPLDRITFGVESDAARPKVAVLVILRQYAPNNYQWREHVLSGRGYVVGFATDDMCCQGSPAGLWGAWGASHAPVALAGLLRAPGGCGGVGAGRGPGGRAGRATAAPADGSSGGEPRAASGGEPRSVTATPVRGSRCLQDEGTSVADGGR